MEIKSPLVANFRSMSFRHFSRDSKKLSTLLSLRLFFSLLISLSLFLYFSPSSLYINLSLSAVVGVYHVTTVAC